MLIAEAITITTHEEATSSRGGFFVGYFFKKASQEAMCRSTEEPSLRFPGFRIGERALATKFLRFVAISLSRNNGL